jgi:hypothetical protein
MGRFWIIRFTFGALHAFSPPNIIGNKLSIHREKCNISILHIGPALGYNTNKRTNPVKQKIWVNKSKSFKEAQEFDDSYYLSMTPTERLETVQFLREKYWKLKKEKIYEGRKRLRRVFKLIKQA